MGRNHNVLAGLVGLVLVLALAAPGSGIGLPTLVSITIDGDMSDWDQVLTNPVQVTHDGDGSSYSNCADSLDRDCPVSGGTGRDLLTFAWTYDTSNVYLLIERWGSSSNTITFFFVMDIDGDGLAQDTDRVLRVRWSGSNQKTNAELYAYAPANAGGDSLVDVGGFADGYSMPGALGALLVAYPQRTGGEATGVRFEEQMAWADLGVPVGTSLSFHVASNNNTDLPGVVDNMGGPDGGSGSFGFGGVEITPAWVRSAGPGDLVSLPHTISNLGNQEGLFDLTGRSSLGLPLYYYTDPEGDGIKNALMAVDQNGDGDFTDSGDTSPGAYDTNSDGKLDFSIPMGGSDYFVVEVQAPPFLDAVTDYLDFHVKLDSPILAEGQVEDQIYIGYVTVYPDRQASAVPGQYVNYGHRVTNNQSFVDTADLVVLSSLGWDVTLFSDPDGDGNPMDGVELARDLGGDGTWDSGDPDTGPLAPAGGTVWYVVRVFVPVTAVPGADVDVTTLTATSVQNANRTGTATDITTVRQRVTVEPDYNFVDGTNLNGSAGKSVYFPFRVINSWITGDSFTLSVVSAQSWTAVLWSDPNGNGSIDDGNIIANTGLVPAMGGVFNLVAEVRVPATALVGDQDTLTVTATSNLEPTQSDSAVGQLEVHLLQTFRDSLYFFQARHFTTCETIYTRAAGLEAGQATRYTLRYRDSGMTLLHEDSLVTNARGFADASRTIAAGEPLGAWTLQIWDSVSSSVLDFVTIEHERAGTVGPVVLSPDPAAAGNDLQISAVYTNTNSSAPYSQTVATAWVRAPDGRVLQDDGTFVPDTGAEVTQVRTIPPLAAGDSSVDIFTITNAAFPMVGAYTVDISWDTGCGDVIVTLAPSVSFQVEVDTDLDGVPDSVDICPTVYNPMQDLLADPLACGQCDVACDDLVACTDESCQAGICASAPDDLNCPDDGLFCNGTEYCDATNDCDSTGDPCAAMGWLCNETSDTCGCAVDADCDDTVGCTDDTCAAGACVYMPNDANCPSDGLYCNGSEICDAAQDCVSSGDPCAVGLYCNDTTDGCDQCQLDSHCGDAVGCTNDACVSGSCVYTPIDSYCVDDGLYCTGLEVCDAVNGCVSTGDPCAAGGQVCDEPADDCVDCLVDANCSDGVACTDNACVGKSCVFTANDANCMDDGLYCNGAEYCDAAAGCRSSGDPCTATGKICNEATGLCEDCTEDSQCDNGLFCDVETCVAGTCQTERRCPDQVCDESSDVCWTCETDVHCDDGQYCNGLETCVGGRCRRGEYPCDDGVECTVNACDEDLDRCDFIPDDFACDDGDVCTQDTCDPAAGCDYRLLDSDGDGVCNAVDPCPKDREDRCDDCRDRDGDGICDDLDPCPYDADNACSMWEGSVPRGGGCGCSYPSGPGGLLVFLVFGWFLRRRIRAT